MSDRFSEIDRIPNKSQCYFGCLGDNRCLNKGKWTCAGHGGLSIVLCDEHKHDEDKKIEEKP